MKFFCRLSISEVFKMREKLEKTKHRFLNIVQKVSFCFFLLLIFTFSCFSQDLPDKIRGYKVHKEKIVIADEADESRKNRDLNVLVKMENPELSDISVSGVKLEVGGEITVFGQSGTIDFISFKDFQINGINVEIEEYKEKLDFKKNIARKLEKPLEIFISTTQTLRAAWKEAGDSKDEWLVTGKIFVFGRFKKMGFNFKRVIPVEIKIKISNPIKSE